MEPFSVHYQVVKQIQPEPIKGREWGVIKVSFYKDGRMTQVHCRSNLSLKNAKAWRERLTKEAPNG